MKKKSEVSKQNIFFYLLIAIMIIFLWEFSFKQVYPYNPPRIIAEAYIPPEGCDVRKYKPGDKISESCADEKYIFLDYWRYGLNRFGRYHNKNGRKFGNYFRIGNDLLVIGYNSSDGAYINNVERDVFIVNSTNSDSIPENRK